MIRPAWLLLLAAVAHAQPDAVDLLESKTLAGLRRFDSGFDGALGVAAIDLETGRSFALNGDTAFPQASVIKIPILVRIFQAARAGELRLDDKTTLTARDAVGGSGRLHHPRARHRHGRG